MLKIESVVPTIGHHHHHHQHQHQSYNIRQSRLFRRSHSTVSSAYLKKAAESNSRTQPQVGALDNKGDNANSDGATQTQNGFYSIKRSKKEREIFPDRINLDRKGLTAIPLIGDEPQLRLLSLQHNLINAFSVADGTATEAMPEASESESCGSSSAASSQGTPPTKEANHGLITLSKLTHPPKRTALHPLNRRLVIGNSYHHPCVIGTPTTSMPAPSIHINGVPNYHARPMFNKTLQLLNVNQKMILKKHAPPVPKADKTPPVPPRPDSMLPNKGQELPSPHGSNYYGNTLQNLVFLDLYDNQIDKIGNLDGLKSLTVLLLGKNRIVDIAGIVSLRNTLRVLDLHGNKISNISHKISRLQELKSLNLAGNLLRQIYCGDFAGLQNLKELNLKRNRIKKINGFDDLRHLERLWLCHNDIQKVEDMNAIAKAINLKEITIENNPVSLAGDCCSFLVSYLPSLALLSQMHVTEQVKRAATAWRKSKETSDVDYVHLSSDVGQHIRREEVISNARTNWELLRSQPHFSAHTAREASAKTLVSTIVIEPHLQVVAKLSHLSPGTSQDSQECPAELNANTASTSNRSSLHEAASDSFRLPPIAGPALEQGPAKGDNVSVEDSLGANVDSASTYSSSTAPSSADREKRTDLEQEIEAEITLMESFVEEEPNSNCPPIAGGTLSSSPLIELSTLPHQMDGPKADELKMPIIKCAPEHDSQAENQSNLSVCSSMKTDNSVASCEDSNGTSSTKNKSRSASNKKAALGLSTVSTSVRAHTAKLSPNAGPVSIVGSQKTANTANNQTVAGKAQQIDREREQGGDYLIEICGRYLNVYGVGALKFIDKQWNVQKAGDVHTVKFSYINFNNICVVLAKIKLRFPNAKNFVFRETNIANLGQLNSLAEVQSLSSVVVEPEGNIICTKSWRSYAVFRLSHWGLKQINGQDITEEELADAERLYARLSDLVLWSLPESMLSPLLGRLRLEESCQASSMSAKEWIMQSDQSLKDVVGKEALQRKTPPALDEQAVRAKGRLHASMLMENTCNAVEKVQQLQALWPAMLTDMIRAILIDYSQMDTYVKNIMVEILK